MQWFLKHYFNVNYGVILLLIFLIFALYLWILSRKRKKQGSTISKKDLIGGVLFITYIVGLFVVTLLTRKPREEYRFELQLFWSYKRVFLKKDMYIFIQILCNILAFIPWGILMPILSDKMRTWGKIIGSAAIISFIIEILQLLLKRGLFEWDDVINNVIGTIIGYAIWKIFYIWKKE